jgi:glucose/arabinose dehydrogenase
MLPRNEPASARRRPAGPRAVLVGLVVVASAVLVAVIVDRATPDVFVPGPTGQPSASARSGGSAFDAARVSVTLAPFVDGLTAPLAIVNAGDGTNRLFVAEQGGRILVIRDGRPVATPFLDIGDEITTGGERGLLGVAFHPDYPRDPRVFVDYTDANGDTQVSSFVVSAGDPDRLDPTETRILHVKQPFANHNGGAVLFDPGGMLLVSLGDGGSGGDPQGNGQSLTTLLGKILRIDVAGSDAANSYRIPADNPFADGAGGHRPEIWLTGLRNPWRMSFDRTTGDLWIGDVGQNAWEEVDVQRAGQPGGTNFGWNRMEGTHCFQPAQDCADPSLTLPVTDYGHDLGCTVIGGGVYRGSAQAALVGGYVFGDYCSGRIWAIDPVGDGYRAPTEVGDSELSLSAFGEDEAGELYAADIGGGAILRVTATTR